MAKRRCKGKTKAGRRCRSTSLMGEYCFAHQPKETKESRGFGGAQERAGRPRVPRATELMRAWVEENAAELLDPYVLGLRATVVTKAGKVPDIELRQRSADRLQDRVFGRPRQVVEHVGSESGPPVAVEVDLGEEARRVLADVLRRRPAAR